MSMNAEQWKQKIADGALQDHLCRLYGSADPARLLRVLDGYARQFDRGDPVRLFSAPGRVELCGNHTDHQQGCVVAAAVDLDILGAACPRPDGVVRLLSQHAPPCEVDLNGAAPAAGTADALVYGVAHRLRQQGFQAGGFNAYTVSAVPVGSGLSSSAAFENWVATVFGCLYNANPPTPLQKALAGQYAENRFFGKPCGLMDQLASCMGGVSFMDFYDPAAPKCQVLSMDLAAMDQVLCVVQTGGSHADLTRHYAAIPAEMTGVARALGQPVLSRLRKEEVLHNITALRETCGDRAVLRALNFFDENERAVQLARALAQADAAAVPDLMNRSGEGSQRWLQNVSNPEDSSFDGIGLALYVSRLACPNGAFRVHGGGFGGTILGLVPAAAWADYQTAMESVFGRGCCIPLRVRRQGGVEITAATIHKEEDV